MSFKQFASPPARSVRDGNGTDSITQLPANILEAFIPGYGIISRFLLEALGFDITLVVSVCFLVFGLATSVRYLWDHASEYFKTYFMSFISIESDDDIYEHVMDWLGEQKVSQDSICLMARTGHHSWDADNVDNVDSHDVSQSELLNFSNWDSKIPPKFQPYFGKHWFWHNGRYFELRRDTKSMMVQNGWASMLRDEETLRLSCIGRSTQPIKDLIKECQNQYFDKKSSRTTVRRPATKEMRARGRLPWTKVAKRPSRPMDTVVLEHDQKELVLADINEYLDPKASKWYGDRGIPYRRGYLFFGPPGTGKSSLSFAIAGIFGLDIYCISLLEPTLTEEDLGLLFNNLPRRCVVLLEDIDSAGLIRRNDPKAETEAVAEAPKAEVNVGAEIAKALEKNAKEKDKTQGISLSGLLNAIDGVASHEGRVLVMTTNHPERLDEALIRPGRVDMKVGFTMASRNQIRKLFTRMYSDDVLHGAAPKPRGQLSSPPGAKLGFGAAKPLPRASVLAADGTLTPPATPEEKPEAEMELEEIAARFADLLPEATFTPAEIQGFLLTRKKEPRRALVEVEAWKDKCLEAKAAKSRLAPS
jgi:chaperone BCS1